jgi:hypothetical protein
MARGDMRGSRVVAAASHAGGGKLDAELWQSNLKDADIRIVGTNLIDISKVDGILEYTQIKHPSHGIIGVVSFGNQ